MNASDHPLVSLFVTFITLSLFSVGGGIAILPDIQRQVVNHYQWMTQIEFTHVLTLVQIAPGPNLLVVSLIGWRVAGLAGLLVATLAMVGPTAVLTYFAGRFFEHHASVTWVVALRNGAIPLVLGFSFASAWIIGQTVDQYGFDVLITLCVASFVALTPYNPLWGFLVGLVIATGMTSYHLWA